MSPFTRLYYAVKPWLPESLRFALRRRRAGAIKRGAVRNWPISQAASRVPDGWRGWPGGKRFAVVLTHDVEGPRGLAQVPALAELERSLGFRSSFNLIPEGAYQVPAALRRELTAGGFEVGVHDLHHDGRLYHSRWEFSRRARRINQYLREWNATGFRSAYMLHNLDWIRDLDIAYDASTFDTDPFEPQPDGVHTIFPFWVPRIPSANGKPESRNSKPETDPSSHSALRTPQPCRDGAVGEVGSAFAGGSSSSNPKPETRNPKPETGSGYVELPYTLPQDSTLFLILGERSIDTWKAKVRWIAKHGGMVLVNVHPDYVRFNGEAAPFGYPAALYREFLEFISGEFNGQYWHGLPRDLAAFVHNSVSHKIPARQRRICVVSATPGGAGGCISELVQVLSRRGDDVEVVAVSTSVASVGPAEVRLPAGAGLESGSAPSQRWTLRQAIRAFSRIAARVTLGHVRQPYDLVHVHGWHGALAFAALVPGLSGVPIVVDHGAPSMDPHLSPSQPACSPFARELLALVESLAARFASHVIDEDDRQRLRGQDSYAAWCRYLALVDRLVKADH